MTEKSLEKFARILVEQVRDAAIREAQIPLSETARGPDVERWRSAMHGPLDAFIRMVIADSVDTTIFRLLLAIDNGEMKLDFEATSGERVKLGDSGELAGWYLLSKEGWRAQYSKEVVFDDHADLKLDFDAP